MRQALASDALASLLALSIIRIVLDALESNVAPFSAALSAALGLAALAAVGCWLFIWPGLQALLH